MILFSHQFRQYDSHLTRERRLLNEESLSYKAGNAAEYVKDTANAVTKRSADFLRGVFDGLKGDDYNEKRKQEMTKKLADFVTTAPSNLVELVANAVKEYSPNDLTPEQFEGLIDHRNWIQAFSDIQIFNDNKAVDNRGVVTKLFQKGTYVTYGHNWSVHTVKALLLSMEPKNRISLYEEYVGNFIPKDVRYEPKFKNYFGAPNQDPKERSALMLDKRAKILGAMSAMLGGDLPPDDTDRLVEDLAFNSLDKHYRGEKGFNSMGLRKDAQQDKKDPNAPSFFAGAKKLGVLTPKVLEKVYADVSAMKENEEINTAKVQDELTHADAAVHIKEANNVLSRMEGWEKLALFGLVIAAAWKYPTQVMIALGTYLGVKYIGGVKDPLGSGVAKSVEFYNYLAGKNEDVRGSLGWKHDKTPAEMANTMVRFAQGEDLHNVEEEAKALVRLNGKTMAELSKAFAISSKGGWKLEMPMLFGGEQNVPRYFKDDEHRLTSTQSVAYVLFSHYRASTQGAADPEVKIINDRMRDLPFGNSWIKAMEDNPDLGKMYYRVVLRGKMSASGDSRQLHKFTTQLVMDHAAATPKPSPDPNANVLSPQSGGVGTRGIDAPQLGQDSTRGVGAPESGVGRARGNNSPEEAVGAGRGTLSPSSGIGSTSGVASPDAGSGASRGQIPPDANRGGNRGVVPPGPLNKQ